jgi:hypothetical protein
MLKPQNVFLAIVLGFIGGYSLVSLVAQAASPPSFTAAGAANLSRPCSHKGVPSEEVNSTGTASTAATAITVGSAFTVTCENKAWMRQGAVGVTGITVTGVPLFSANVPYWFLSEESGQYVGFIKKSGETDGKCYVTECR